MFFRRRPKRVDIIDLDPKGKTDEQKLEWLKESGGAEERVIGYIETHLNLPPDISPEDDLLREQAKVDLEEAVRIARERHFRVVREKPMTDEELEKRRKRRRNIAMLLGASLLAATSLGIYTSDTYHDYRKGYEEQKKFEGDVRRKRIEEAVNYFRKGDNELELVIDNFGNKAVEINIDEDRKWIEVLVVPKFCDFEDQYVLAMEEAFRKADREINPDRYEYEQDKCQPRATFTF